MTAGTGTATPALVSLDDVRRAAERIGGRVHRTSVLRSSSLGKAWGVRLDLKAELFQRTGSFKARGALNTVLSLPAAERARGVITVSAGNAGAAVAFAAASVGVPGTVVMPATAVSAKVAACRAYGADVVLTDGDLVDTYLATVATTGRIPVHPFDHPRPWSRGPAPSGWRSPKRCPTPRWSSSRSAGAVSSPASPPHWRPCRRERG